MLKGPGLKKNGFGAKEVLAVIVVGCAQLYHRCAKKNKNFPKVFRLYGRYRMLPVLRRVKDMTN